MTRKDGNKKHTLIKEKHTLTAKEYTLTKITCTRSGARCFPPYLCRCNPLPTMQSKRHISADTGLGTRNFRETRRWVATKRIFPYLRPVCWRCSPSLWQLGKNRFIRMAASAAPHERGRRFRQGWRSVRLAGSPTGQAYRRAPTRCATTALH